MSVKTNRKPLALAVGAALATSMSISTAAQADSTEFSMTALSSGYMVDVGEGKCGECGGEKGEHDGEKDAEGKCGGSV